MPEPQVVVYPDPGILAAAAAARLLTVLSDAQAARGATGEVSVALTGGRTGIAVLEQLRTAPARDAVDWSRVRVFWGDERFLPDGDPERNESQARSALLDQLPIRPGLVHPMAASGGELGDDLDAAAEAYAATLASISSDEVPPLDVCLLGVGEEGHVASIFPDSPAVHAAGATVVAVRDCPKPPPTRITLTLPAIRTADEVWLITAGSAKAEAVARALGGAGEVELPAAGARGRRHTRWLLDRAAAERLPGSIVRR